MSDETARQPTEPEGETPVGDMTEEGQTEIGPHPSLTHLENIEPADLAAAAEIPTDAAPGDED